MDVTWFKTTDALPEMIPDPLQWPASIPVLVFTKFGAQKVATLELVDEDDGTPEWFSNCSERWNISKDVTHWTRLPNADDPMWLKVSDALPELVPDPLMWPTSKPVLTLTKFGAQKVATLELFDEDDGKPEWYTNCSEHWNIDKDVTHWTHLPADPA